MAAHFSGTPRQTRALDTYIKLMRASNTVSARLNRTLAREHRLTESQLGVLEALLHLGPMSQTQLCAKILRSGSNLTTVLDNLERDGLVQRIRDTSDRRVQMVHLTEEGRRHIAGVFPAHVQTIVEALDGLSATEHAELARLCRKLGLAAADRQP